MSVFFYDTAVLRIFNGTVDLDTTVMKMMLVLATSNAASRGIADIEFVSDITFEVSGGSYARQTLGSVTVADAGSSVTKWDSTTDVLFTAVPTNASQVLSAVVFAFITNDADSIPMVYLDGSIFPITTTGDNITVKFNASGIGQATAQLG